MVKFEKIISFLCLLSRQQSITYGSEPLLWWYPQMVKIRKTSKNFAEVTYQRYFSFILQLQSGCRVSYMRNGEDLHSMADRLGNTGS